jgi:hypothetical protein
MSIPMRLSWCVLVVMLAWTTPAGARVVNLTSAAPLADYSDAAIDRAIETAVESCVGRATAMGLSWIWLHDAAVTDDGIVVHMVATDEEWEGDDVPAETERTRPDEPTVIDVVPSAPLVRASPR